jgi:hypothetical protein
MAELTIEIPDDAPEIEGRTDDRGRMTLGSEFAEQHVRVVVVESRDREVATAD